MCTPGDPEDDDIWEFLARQWAEVVQNLLRRVPVHSATTGQIFALAKEHVAETDRLKAQHNETTRRVLQQADVIGVLATHLGEIIHVLGRINAKVVICGEAGEVLEGHLISAVTPQCQHLVQIGDHQQLRPAINSYSLSIESDTSGKEYRLDESMFERLIKENSLPIIRLNVQWRMRPEIADLLRSTLDHHLQDHPATKKYPDVLGVHLNVFWLNHNNPETQSNGTTAKMPVNQWEARMAHELVCHLVRQGQYAAEDIVVLTPYPSQLRLLQQKLNDDFVTILSDEDNEALAQAGLDSVLSGGRDTFYRGSVTGSAFKDNLRVATV